MEKVVVITGASSGIGLTTAKYLIEKGYKVYGIARKQFSGEGFECFQADVNDSAAVEEIFKKIYEKEGSIYALINNAGFGIAGAIEDAKPENIAAQISTNLTSVITLCSKVIPFIKKTGGKIVNISSVGGIIPLPFQACYSASKSGVEIFSRALATEVRPLNIKVTAVLPGDTKTGFTQARVVDEKADSTYSKRMHHSVSKMEHDEQHGKSPITVAKTIAKVLKKKRPPLKICVGGSAKFIVFLGRVMPTRFVNFVVRKLYG